MYPNSEILESLLQKLKTIGFWQRVFNWKSVRQLSYDAFEEYGRKRTSYNNLQTDLEESLKRQSELEKENEIVKSKNESIPKIEAKIEILESEKNRLNGKITELEKSITQYEQTETSRLEEYQKNIESVKSVKEGLESDRNRLNDERVKEKENIFLQMKETWRDHESNVEAVIRDICRNNFIEYMNQVPFKGKPDNTIKIAEEFIIFDAKSPANDDLSNFPKYLKVQVDSVKKYINQENVKKDIFLVIPSNTTEVIKDHFVNMGDYNVYIVTTDSLEPIILSLKRIEDYEFAEQLTPEERENICRIIGKFTHTTKRKIQIDYFFSHQFLEILTKCKTDLPDDIMKTVIEFEKAEKLNPPQEKRSKQILTNDLIADNEKLAIEARAKLLDADNDK